MSLTNYHKELITNVARALGDLNSKAAFVGGVVVGLYADDPAAPEVRPTDDVDITLEIASRDKLEVLRQKLVGKGFKQSANAKVTCRFYLENIKVDVMTTHQIGWAPANRWFKPGFKDLTEIDINGVPIKILSLPYFLASKFSAYKGRGQDPRTSHDLEDITYVLDNRTDLVKQLNKSPEDVFEFLTNEFKKILNNESMQEAVVANLEYPIQAERFSLIEDKLNEVIESQ